MTEESKEVEAAPTGLGVVVQVVFWVGVLFAATVVASVLAHVLYRVFVAVWARS